LGNRPGAYIVFSLLLTAAACSGFSDFKSENRSEKLWIPQGTQAQDDSTAFTAVFSNPFRINWLIAEPTSASTNMLSKASLQSLMALHDDIEAIEAQSDDEITLDEPVNLKDLCYEMYGGGHQCFINSVLQYWNYDSTTLASDADVQQTLVDNAEIVDLEGFLSGFEIKDGEYFAKAAKITYFLENRDVCSGGNCEDKPATVWEGAFLEVAEDCAEGFKCVRFAGRSFSDEFGAAIKGDVVLMNIGFLIIIVYLAVNLSGAWCDFLSSKITLSLMSVVAVGLAIGSSMGVSQLCGWAYAPVHTVLPFVLLGLGVDDSFVIMNSFDQTNPEDELPKRMRETMKHAGVSITVTSVTDFVAFIISTATALPALASFCFYAAAGILFLFLYQCIFFGAFVVIDARQTAARNYCCSCIKAKPNDERDKRMAEYKKKPSMVTRFMKDTYGPTVVKPFAAIVIAVAAIALAGVGVWGAASLKVDSNQLNFIPDSSYVKDTFATNDELFGGDGVAVDLVMGKIDYFVNRKAIVDSKTKLEGQAHLESFDKSYESWMEGFVAYNAAACFGACVGSNSMDSDGLPNDENQFYANLATYLDGPGAQYSGSVVWVDELTKLAIKGSKIGMRYDAKINDDAQLCVEAMEQLRDEVEALGIPTAYPYTFEYLTWETFIIIGNEMIMNVSLCMAAVFVITLILIASPVTALLVFFCVACAIIEILGAMHFWGLIIDNVSVINLTLAVGLAVDYSAHVGHCFMVKPGTNGERVVLALEDIGSAVLNGAISTFLAVVALSGSDSYVFRVLFKQFFLTCVFGVFNGMVFLPVLLLWFGPAPFSSAHGGHGGAKVVAGENEEMEKAFSTELVSKTQIEL
jgi:predicted RND superfamily exporter protein